MMFESAFDPVLKQLGVRVTSKPDRPIICKAKWPGIPDEQQHRVKVLSIDMEPGQPIMMTIEFKDEATG